MGFTVLWGIGTEVVEWGWEERKEVVLKKKKKKCLMNIPNRKIIGLASFSCPSKL